MTTVEITKKVIENLIHLATSLETLINAVDKNNDSKNSGDANPGSGDSKNNEAIKGGNTNVIDAVSADSEKRQVDENDNLKNGSRTDVKSGTEQDIKQPALEEVRAFLADKSRDGHREAIKAILLKYGADKLTSLDPVHYSKVLKEAGELV